MKASAGSTRPTQSPSPSQTPQGGNTTGGEQHRHRGETAHRETHPPTPTVPSSCCSLYIIGLLRFLGHKIDEAIEVYTATTSNKAAYDLCSHRFNSAQNSRHIDGKLFKMRELRGLGVVTVAHVPTAENPADLVTKGPQQAAFRQAPQVCAQPLGRHSR